MSLGVGPAGSLAIRRADTFFSATRAASHAAGSLTCGRSPHAAPSATAAGRPALELGSGAAYLDTVPGATGEGLSPARRPRSDVMCKSKSSHALHTRPLQIGGPHALHLGFDEFASAAPGARGTDVPQFVTKDEMKDAGKQRTKGAWVRPGRRRMPELGAQPPPSTWKLFESPTRGCLWRAHRVGVIDEIFCLRLAQSGPSTPPPSSPTDGSPGFPKVTSLVQTP